MQGASILKICGRRYYLATIPLKMCTSIPVPLPHLKVQYRLRFCLNFNYGFEVAPLQLQSFLESTLKSLGDRSSRCGRVHSMAATSFSVKNCVILREVLAVGLPSCNSQSGTCRKLNFRKTTIKIDIVFVTFFNRKM
ncbi:Uncharacterised protein g10136 [Pycnogonum litorale]